MDTDVQYTPAQKVISVIIKITTGLTLINLCAIAAMAFFAALALFANTAYALKLNMGYRDGWDQTWSGQTLHGLAFSIAFLAIPVGLAVLVIIAHNTHRVYYYIRFGTDHPSKFS